MANARPSGDGTSSWPGPPMPISFFGVASPRVGSSVAISYPPYPEASVTSRLGPPSDGTAEGTGPVLAAASPTNPTPDWHGNDASSGVADGDGGATTTPCCVEPEPGDAAGELATPRRGVTAIADTVADGRASPQPARM